MAVLLTADMAVGGCCGVLAVTRETRGLVELDQLGTRGAVPLELAVVTAVERGRGAVLLLVAKHKNIFYFVFYSFLLFTSLFNHMRQC